MEGASGLDLVPTVLARDPDSVVVMISGQQTIEYAIEAMRVGAFDYITKPLDILHVKVAVRRALKHRELLTSRRRHESQLEQLVRERTAEIERLAYYDKLTGLPNRLLFSDRCAQAIAAARMNEHTGCVLLISIDRFKNINDTLGHVAGDQLLREIASRLQERARPDQVLARFEGPEFGLLMPQVNGNSIEQIALTTIESLRESFRLAAQEVYVTTSVGISRFPVDGERDSVILGNTGAALQEARKRGGNNYQVYRAEMNASAQNRLALETSLRHALDNHEFITYYQPVVDLKTARIVATEALVRWQHPQLGLLQPCDFLGLAEDTGLISEISYEVMRSACFQTRRWQLEGLDALRAAVNVSARQFQEQDLMERIVRTLNDSSLEPAFLELELTETSIMENPDSAARLLNTIRELGVRIAIDDFGTGYSSLNYLKRLPLDTLKVDRSFVNGAATNVDDKNLVTAIVNLAHNLRLRVIAEGIETEEQLNFLRSVGCDEGQGYLFNKPHPPKFWGQAC